MMLNDDLIGAAEEFPAQAINELDYEFSDQELTVFLDCQNWNEW